MKSIKILIVVLFFGLLGFSLEMGSLTGKMPVLKGKAPVHTSKYFVAHGEIVDGKAVFNVPISSSNPLIVLLGVKSDNVAMDNVYKLKARNFHTPELENMEVPGMGTRIDGKNITPGYHTVVFDVKTKEKKSVDLVVSEPDSPVALKLTTEPLAVKVGDTVVIKADLGKDVSSINTMVKAVVNNEDVIYLKDDGEYPDEVKGDGIFTASLIADTDKPFSPEMVKVEAIGTTKEDVPFMRNATATFMVSNPKTFVDGSIVDNGNSISIPLAPAEGRFRVEVIYGSGDLSVAYVRDDIVLNGEGKTVVLPRPNEALEADRAIVRVLNMDTLGVEIEENIFVPQIKDFDEDFYLIKARKRAIHKLPVSKKNAAEKYGENPPHAEVK